MRVLFLTQTPQIGAAARYRVYQYINYLQAEGIDCAISPATSANAVRNLTLRGSLYDRLLAYSQPFITRTMDLSRIKKYDIIFVQRDILIHLPPIFEWVISRLNKNFIFDYDDALYTHPPGGKYPLFYRFKGRNKIPSIIEMSKYVIAGNRHLQEYALRFNKNVEIIPTSIDTDKYPNKKEHSNCTSSVIGWIGRPGSSWYLKQFQGTFQKLARNHNFIFKAIGAKNFKIEGVKVIAKDWKLEEEIKEIYDFDIGVMPLCDNEWTVGKSATKILQCMAVGIPVVCSAVGANRDIISDGENGFLAKTEDEWLYKLSLLLKDSSLREKIGSAARLHVEKNYSVKSSAPKLKQVLRKVYEERL